jgi:UDP:flavonoid glycosyltransferase YjiC (YdhE family)
MTDNLKLLPGKKVPGASNPPNVLVTDWLPAHQVNQLADLSLFHSGIGTVMIAADAGKPVVGIGMQPEQVANLACLVRKGFAIRIPKSKDPSRKVQEAEAKRNVVKNPFLG